MQRWFVATVVSFGYAAYWAAILLHGLFAGLTRPHPRLAPWLIVAILGLLCYAMATRRRWARGLGLVVAIGGLILWTMVGLWLYALSGFSSRSGDPTLFSWEMATGVLPQLLFSVALIVLLAQPLGDKTAGDKGDVGRS
jgi:hypothetical protein